MKKLLVISIVLLVVGAVILAAAFAFVKFDFKKISSEELMTNTYYAENSFSNIEIDSDDCKVTLIPSEDEVCKIVCTETEKVKFKITDENGTLKIVYQDSRSWVDRIGIFIAEKTVDVYLPQNEYENLKIGNSSGGVVISDGLTFSEIQTNTSSGSVKCYADADVLSVKVSSGSIKLDGVSALEINLESSSGSIKLDNISSENINLEATSGSVKLDSVNAEKSITVESTSGSVELNSVSCENLNASASSGSVKLFDVIASDSMKVKSSSGSVNLNDSDASDIEIKTTSGSVKGTLLSEKIFVTETSSGSVNVPASFEGGKCYIKTSSGSINIKISSEN